MSFDGNPRLGVRRLPAEIYAAPEGVPLHADVHLPEGTDEPPPAIVWIHGGGWRAGNRHVAPDLSRFFATRGFAMVSIDYRLSSQALFPAQIEDVRTAIRWLRRAGPALGIAADRIGLWGASAGGHLAALAALAPEGCFRSPGTTDGDHDGAVQAVAIGYGPTDFLQMDAHRPPPGTLSTDPESLRLPRLDMRSADADSYESLLLGAPIDTCPDLVRTASPIAYVGRHAPPFLILHGSCDTTVAPHQSELLYTALAEAGTEVTLALIEGVGHGFLNRSHLDDHGPRRAAIRHHPAGGEETSTTRDLLVFSTIEAFFRDALNPA